MNDKLSISDDPLPDSELVAALPDSGLEVALPDTAAGDLQKTAYAKADTLPGAEHTDAFDHLPPPRLETAVVGDAHHASASFGGRIQLDLHDPELIPAEKTELHQPIWGEPASPTVQPDMAVAEPQTQEPPKPSLPPVLAHLAQVGMTSADHWEEQIQPRLQQLHEDIAQVHTQLDMLERQKPNK